MGESSQSVLDSIPASLKIKPEEAKARLQEAVKGLVKEFGFKRLADKLKTPETTIRSWAHGTEPRYSKAIEVIALYDIHRKALGDDA